ncbi:MAG: Release factor glutamine methyltransferase [Pedosphaera sp.]|nr:Release factor glutamine methyltransferase [Pedosphaera sp.]
MTVLEVIQRSAAFLAKKEVESPRLQVELLLAHLLQMRRMDLYLNFARELTPKDLDELRAMVTRRGQREPLQQIVGSTSFWGLEITVNAHVLVPRPETELLAEMGWAFLNAELGNKTSNIEHRTSNIQVPEGGAGDVETANAGNIKALDFGTGSGCLAIALAVKSPAAQIVAVDVSAEALAVARENAARHKVESRIRFVEGDGFAALAPGERFDLIVSNPPYIPSGEIATLEPEVRDHDPRLALDGGADGLAFYRRLAREAGAFLKPGGRIMLELGDGQAAAVQNLFTEQKWVVEAVKPDYNGRQRNLVARQ